VQHGLRYTKRIIRALLGLWLFFFAIGLVHGQVFHSAYNATILTLATFGISVALVVLWKSLRWLFTD